MTLELGSGDVKGVYFYATQLKDIHVNGELTDGSNLVLDEFDATGNVVARFEGTFPEHGPRGEWGGRRLECELIIGSWHKLNAVERLPFHLTLSSTNGGDLEHRYVAASALDDDLVDRNARRFWDAVKRGDKETVASLIHYPITVELASARRRIHSRKELVDSYDAIFSVAYRDAIGNALPRDMFARDQGIMLDDGIVWFGSDGRVKALNNF